MAINSETLNLCKESALNPMERFRWWWKGKGSKWKLRSIFDESFDVDYNGTCQLYIAISNMSFTPLSTPAT